MGTRTETSQDGTDTTIRLDLETEDGKKQEIFIDDKGNYLLFPLLISVGFSIMRHVLV